MRTLKSLTALALLAQLTAGQLADLQPGRNFPVVTDAFGMSVSENIDVADVDRDGDLDVGVGNGGDGASQPNRIYINLGGIQGGTEGTFQDETALRFLGAPDGKTRDIEFADWDDDGDLDFFEANSGSTASNGQVARAHLNQGGAQLGNIGFFQEATDDFWGRLISVPLNQEVGLQDGLGAWKVFSCDCDFGDLDDDGDLDLFISTYGVNMNGIRDSRIFLNDGLGRFNELWPWADPAADTKLHTRSIDLADFDGDFDLDVIASSRNSQARIYRNNLAAGSWPTDAFTDRTQQSLIDTGAKQLGTSNYEVEFGDADGDGDFDLWMLNYAGFGEELLENNGDFTFSKSTWIKGDVVFDEFETDFLDYDGDGDLDAFAANFSGVNQLYQSSVADGVDPAEGILHNTGGSVLAPWPETPEFGNSGSSLDGECADLDGDGDPDILLANDNQQQNRYWENVLGIPDTHAPTFQAVTVQTDKADGSETVIHAAVRDNDPYYIVAFHTVDLIYAVNGGPETCVRMFSQGSQQFRGVIPGALSGAIAYRVVATDGNGNTGVSVTTVYQQTAGGSPRWQNLGCGTTGVNGDPYLQLSGAQLAGEAVTLSLVDCPPNAFFLLWLSYGSSPLSAVGGTVYANPLAVQVLAATDAGGMVYATTTWPPGVPPGTETWWQAIVADTSSIHGLVLSNAVHGVSP